MWPGDASMLDGLANYFHGEIDTMRMRATRRRGRAPDEVAFPGVSDSVGDSMAIARGAGLGARLGARLA